MVIFDCDGVLVDSERLAVEIDVQWIGSLGWPITKSEVVDRFLGKSYADVLKEITAHIGRPLPPQFEDSWDAEYSRVFDEQLEAVPGVAMAITEIQHQGFQTCVGSSGSHERIRRSLTVTDLWDIFAGRIFSISDVVRGKPAPDLFLHAATEVGIAPSRCVVVEDSKHGVTAAHEAGMKVVGFGGGITPAVHLQYADEVIEAMSDLPTTVNRLIWSSHVER